MYSAILLAGKTSSEQFLLNLVATPKGKALKTCCDNKSFLRTKLEFSENVQTGGINSVETTRLARTETRHDFLAHGDLLRVSLYGHQGGDSVLVPQ